MIVDPDYPRSDSRSPRSPHIVPSPAARQSLSPSATTLHFEYYLEEGDARPGSALQVIHLPSVDQHSDQTAGHVMERLLATHKVPQSKQV